MSLILCNLIQQLMKESNRTHRQMTIPEMRFIIGGISASCLKEFDLLLKVEFEYEIKDK